MEYEINPADFRPSLNVVGCLVELEKKVLLLRRNVSSTQGGKWGLPSGKVESGENFVDSMTREVKEETGIMAEKSDFKFIKDYKVRLNGESDFIYLLFYLGLEKKKDIKLNTAEHSEFKWVDFKELSLLPLVPGTDLCINAIFRN